MPVEPQKPYISSKEAARKYDLTYDHIGLLCRRGKIQGLLWGRIWYVSEPSLEDYLKKNLEVKEARKQALSKQWRAAWTAAFLGFVIYSACAGNASADYVTPPPRLNPPPSPLQISVATISAAVGEIEKGVPMPALPQLAAPAPTASPVKPASRGLSFAAYVGEVAVQLAETLADMFAPQGAPVRVVYAKEYVPEAAAQNQFANVLDSIKENVAALATAPAPDLSYTPAQTAPLFTQENLLAGTEAANGAIGGFNDALFGAYALSISTVAEVAKFDAAQAGFVYDRIFGEFGRQYVSDLTKLNDAQVGFYVSSANALDPGYNTLADALDRAPRLDSSISVVSANYAAAARSGAA